MAHGERAAQIMNNMGREWFSKRPFCGVGRRYNHTKTNRTWKRLLHKLERKLWARDRGMWLEIGDDFTQERFEFICTNNYERFMRHEHKCFGSMADETTTWFIGNMGEFAHGCEVCGVYYWKFHNIPAYRCDCHTNAEE